MKKHNYNIFEFQYATEWDWDSQGFVSQASPQDHKLRKYLCLKFYLNIYFSDLQIWTTRTFKHNINILVDYQNYFKKLVRNFD